MSRHGRKKHGERRTLFCALNDASVVSAADEALNPLLHAGIAATYGLECSFRAVTEACGFKWKNSLLRP